MRLIKGPTQLPYSPKACAVTNRSDGDFIDLQVVIERLEPTRLYLKTEIVEQAARLCGMVPAKEVEELRGRVAELEAKYTALDRVADAAVEYVEALEGVAA